MGSASKFAIPSELLVKQPGMLATLQDLGRWGYQRFGVSTSGAMDATTARIANRLVGNEESCAVLEITLWGGQFRLPAGCVAALVGADLEPRWSIATGGEQAFPQGRPVWIEESGDLRMGTCHAGCRAYLAISGGFQPASVLGSRSTLQRAKLGGWQGRKLMAGDSIPIGESRPWSLIEALQQIPLRTGIRSSKRFLLSPSMDDAWRTTTTPVILRMTLGHHFQSLEPLSQRRFLGETFVLSSASDRMGYRLNGPNLTFEHSMSLPSSGVVMGTIQLPPGGEPIIVMADGAPTGGYPRIGHIISADHSKAGQLRVGQACQFQEVSQAEAISLWEEHEQDWRTRLTMMGLEFNSR